MGKLVWLDPEYYQYSDIGFWCPGCNSQHEISVGRPTFRGARWSYNSDPVKPTFSPSYHLKINTPDMGARYQPDVKSTVCHSWIRDGKIQFLLDCTHALAGQTVDLPDFPEGRAVTSKRL